MNAEAIAKALGGHRAGRRWMCLCPAHDDREPSLSITDGSDGKVLIHCFAGCAQGDVIDALRKRGLWTGAAGRHDGRYDRRHRREVRPEPDTDALKNAEWAFAIWRASRPAEGTEAEAYLHSRGIVIPVPLTIRFRPALKHPEGGAGRRTLVTEDDGEDWLRRLPAMGDAK